MTDKDVRERAARTAVDAFTAVERIYRHSYQVLMSLKEQLKTEFNLKEISPFSNSPIYTVDPSTWIWRFRGLYLSTRKIALEEYRKDPSPILFLQASMHNPDGRAPLLRYGTIEKISDFSPLKTAKFDDYFRMIMLEIHTRPKQGQIKASNCKATMDFVERELLDIREDRDIADLAKEIYDRYAKALTQR